VLTARVPDITYGININILRPKERIRAPVEPRPSTVRKTRRPPAGINVTYLRAWGYTTRLEKPLALEEERFRSVERLIPRGVINSSRCVIIPRGLERFTRP